MDFRFFTWGSRPRLYAFACYRRLYDSSYMLRARCYCCTSKLNLRMINGSSPPGPRHSLPRHQILAQPPEDGVVPELRVLRLEHPMPLVREIEQLGIHTSPLKRRK